MAGTAVLVLMGGPDAEREVSLMSGREMAAALRSVDRFRVSEAVIDRPTSAELRCIIEDSQADVIVPALHGQWGEGGPLQELLEGIGVPFVGSDARASRYAMNKIITKQMLEPYGVPTPSSRQWRRDDPTDLDPPLVLKPVDDGSSVDLRICRSVAQVEAARRELHAHRPILMAERLIDGREITVGVLGDRPLPLIEIKPSDAVEFYDYEAKYTRDDTQYVIEPELPPAVEEACRQIAMTAYQRLGCRDLARVDLMVDDAGPWFLEINTMPGFTTHSLVPMAARAVGYEMPQLCAMLVDSALARQPESAQPTTGSGRQN